jgi:cytochrome c553
MRMRQTVGAFALAALLPGGAAYAQSGDPAAGESKSSQCAGCHGIPGWRNAYPAYRVPKLGGQHPAYLIAALKAYKSGARAHPTMHAIAAGLSEQDMADLAAFFGGAAPNEARKTP